MMVTGGEFWMGSDGDGDESPRHRVAVRSFCMDTTEVTVDAYRGCVDSGGCTPARPERSFCNAATENRGDHPINCVDWGQAHAACAAMGKRLPTEREWEYAARGGAEQRIYPWGNDPPDGRACYAHEGTCKVGSYAPNAFGLVDLGGNVWEWTSSYFGRYPDEASTGITRVYRGGSFSRRFPKWMRNALRNRFRPDEWGAHLGFRCAADLTGAACPPGSTEGPNGCVVEGNPTMPSGYASSPVGAGNHGRPRAHEPGAKAPADSSNAPAREQNGGPVTRSRDPRFDADCEKWKPGRPVAYMIRGGEFADRQRQKGACVNRDVGIGFNSVCCRE